MAIENNESNEAQSNDQAGQDVDSLYNSIMSPEKEPQEPLEGNQEPDNKAEPNESVNTDQGTADVDKFILKHKDFENGEREFTREKAIEYAQKGFDYELKMHQLKQEREAWANEKKNFEGERETFTKDREYWSNVDQYMKDNPGFAQVVQQEFAKIQGEQANVPMTPEVQTLHNQIAALQERLDAQDNATQEKSQKVAEEKFVKSTVDYKREHSDFDWEGKDEFGQSLQSHDPGG